MRSSPAHRNARGVVVASSRGALTFLWRCVVGRAFEEGLECIDACRPRQSGFSFGQQLFKLFPRTAREGISQDVLYTWDALRNDRDVSLGCETLDGVDDRPHLVVSVSVASQPVLDGCVVYVAREGSTSPRRTVERLESVEHSQRFEALDVELDPVSDRPLPVGYTRWVVLWSGVGAPAFLRGVGIQDVVCHRGWSGVEGC